MRQEVRSERGELAGLVEVQALLEGNALGARLRPARGLVAFGAEAQRLAAPGAVDPVPPAMATRDRIPLVLRAVAAGDDDGPVGAEERVLGDQDHGLLEVEDVAPLDQR